MTDLPPELFKHWVYSHDSDGISVYRPFGTRLPPARGRRAFEIREDGEFVRYDIGATDRSRAVVGRWRAEGPRRIRISYEDGQEHTLDVIDCGPDELKVRASEG
jgi:hypothetical protein